MSPARILVVGSVNLDFVATAAKLPARNSLRPAKP